jgi:glutamate--cysteine ligase
LNIVQNIREVRSAIDEWLCEQEKKSDLPFYFSVDVRNAGFKMVVVDTNLFPAGFNNLCAKDIQNSANIFRLELQARNKAIKDILLVSEDHTRNKWYLENIAVLEDIIARAGYKLKVAANLENDEVYLDLKTATNRNLRIYNLKLIVDSYKSRKENIDLIILNNDLTAGVPNILSELDLPIYPSLAAGWHRRLKSVHFSCMQDVVGALSKVVGLDPWFFSSFYTACGDVNVNEDQDRERLADMAADLFRKIKSKYKEYGINEQPFIFLKSDSGTYGMGVQPIEDANDILELNRKARNKLFKGKGSQVITKYILQEGVPTINKVGNSIGEPCIYSVGGKVLGGFYRFHENKTGRENLNSVGMEFKSICNKKFHGVACNSGDCGLDLDPNFDVYSIVSRIAGIAAARER